MGANGRFVYCNDREYKYRDALKIITASTVSVYDLSDCVCLDELKSQLIKIKVQILPCEKLSHYGSDIEFYKNISRWNLFNYYGKKISISIKQVYTGKKK